MAFSGSQVDPSSVSAQSDQNSSPVVVFEFQGAARSAFATYTGDHIGQYLTITVDSKVVESATIQSQISGQAQISGMQSLADAQALAAELKSAPLPMTVTLVSADVVRASAD